MNAQLQNLKRTPTVFIVELAVLIYKVPSEPVGQIVETSHSAAHVLALITYCKSPEWFLIELIEAILRNKGVYFISMDTK